MDRAAFLDRLRDRLRTPAPANLPHPLRDVEVVPAVGYPFELSDPVAAFEQTAAAAGSTVLRASSAQEALERVLSGARIRSAVVSLDPETDGVENALRQAGVEVLAFDSPDGAARADLGVTGAAYAIAATGTLVLHAGRAGGRTAGLLPPVHLALVRAANVLPDSGALFRHLPDRFPDGLPSQLVLATGPSRSGDIEFTITVGVHGPGTVYVALLED